MAMRMGRQEVLGRAPAAAQSPAAMRTPHDGASGANSLDAIKREPRAESREPKLYQPPRRSTPRLSRCRSPRPTESPPPLAGEPPCADEYRAAHLPAASGEPSAAIPGTGARAGALARSRRRAAVAFLLVCAAVLAAPMAAQADTLVTTLGQSSDGSQGVGGSTDIASGSWSTSPSVLRMSLDGVEKAASTDATLSGLALKNAADDSAIPLNPSFATARRHYFTDVENDVTSVTVESMVTESNATVEYLDHSNTELKDADLNTTGFQVALAVGVSSIKVKVTAEDRATTKVYTVAVTRAIAISSDATLSGLALKDAADSAITLSPAFATATKSYTALVVNAHRHRRADAVGQQRGDDPVPERLGHDHGRGQEYDRLPDGAGGRREHDQGGGDGRGLPHHRDLHGGGDAGDRPPTRR